MTTRAASRPLLAVLGAALCAATVPACGRDAPIGITRVVERTDGEPPAPEAGPERRFGAAVDPTADPHARLAMPSDPAPRAAAWTFTTPPGWRELGPAPFRDAGWQVVDAPDVQCSFSTLGGAGGGLASNVDRWRQQMSLPPEGEAGLAALPRHPWLGASALRVELTGVYGGMGGAGRPGSKLLGLLVQLPGRAAFLKMVGPAASVDAEAGRFLALAASLAPAAATGGALPVDAPAAAEAPDATPSPFTWTAPPEWTRKGARTLRLATYAPKGARGTEIAVSMLPGPAGGTRLNLDRWRAQMGLPALSDAEFDALPRATILGGAAVFLAADGRYTGMAGSGAAGAEPTEGARLAAVAVARAKDMVFVKMTGPADEVRAEEARFRAFCESLRE